MDTEKRNQMFLDTFIGLTAIVKDVTRQYLKFVELGEYEGDGDSLTHEILSELFHEPVSEVCFEAIVRYAAQHEDNCKPEATT